MTMDGRKRDRKGGRKGGEKTGYKRECKKSLMGIIAVSADREMGLELPNFPQNLDPSQ